MSAYDDLWDIHTFSEEDDHEFDAATRRAWAKRVAKHNFAQAQEDRDTGNQLDPLLFDEEPEEEGEV